MGINDSDETPIHNGESLKLDFGTLVEEYYQPLYRFALSLSQSQAEACDLTQQTFYLWATKGHQLRDISKVKTWLFSTLHHEFLNAKRHDTRFPHREIKADDSELPNITPNLVNQMDSLIIMESLMQVEKLYRAPLTLFYLESHSYQEMSEILNVPIGTIMSRLSRGKQQLREILADANKKAEEKVSSLSLEQGGKKYE